MINWLNNNEGFVMCLLTLVYVLATIIIVVMNKISTSEMKKARKEDSRPYIMANLVKDPRDMCFYIRIKNYGKTGAIIDNLEISPDLKLIKESGENISLKGCMFPPQHVIQFIILEKWDETSKNDYCIKISYDSIEDKKRHFADEYKLVTQYAHMQGYTNKKKSGASDIDNALISISNSLDSIRNKL